MVCSLKLFAEKIDNQDKRRNKRPGVALTLHVLL